MMCVCDVFFFFFCLLETLLEIHHWQLEALLLHWTCHEAGTPLCVTAVLSSSRAHSS